MHFEASLVLKVPRDKAYLAYTDFESWPKWSKDRSEVKVSRRDGNTVSFESHAGSRARALKLFPSERVESEGETRFSRTKSIVMFEDASEGTRVTASLDVELKGHWSWLFKTQGKAVAEASALEELSSFAKYVESLP